MAFRLMLIFALFAALLLLAACKTPQTAPRSQLWGSL